MLIGGYRCTSTMPPARASGAGALPALPSPVRGRPQPKRCTSHEKERVGSLVWRPLWTAAAAGLRLARARAEAEQPDFCGPWTFSVRTSLGLASGRRVWRCARARRVAAAASFPALGSGPHSRVRPPFLGRAVAGRRLRDGGRRRACVSCARPRACQCAWRWGCLVRQRRAASRVCCAQVVSLC